MPRRETRTSIERALAEQRRKASIAGTHLQTEMMARMERELARMRDLLDPAQFVRIEKDLKEAVRKLGLEVRRRRRRPDDGGMPALVEPPRGPRPFQGGAAAPLEFDS